jgi:pteridine reductase
MSSAPVDRVALVTGGGQRIGAAIVRALHASGCRTLIHYRRSREPALHLAATLNAARADSCAVLEADLCEVAAVLELARRASARWGRIDLLVNNASDFFPTPLGGIDLDTWNRVFGSNLQGPFFLSQALAPALASVKGAIVNIVDVHATIPLPRHTPYTMAKAGLAMMTRALALELAPDVRVNAVAPGAILWPAEPNPELSPERAGELLANTALRRIGHPDDIAGAVRYLGLEAPYVTGQILAVDGGRSLF